MQITNKWNLSDYVIKLLGKRYQPKKERIGVSTLIDSPRIRTLQIEKWDEITQDVSTGLTALGGLSLHTRAEKFAETDEMAEQKLEDSVDSEGLPLGLTLVGKADNYKPARQIISITTTKLLNDNQIRDWKSMAVYGLKWPDKVRKMTEQLNMYAWQRLIRKQAVESLYLDIYWKNWKYEEWERADDKLYTIEFDLTSGGVVAGYPPIPYTLVKLPLWPFEVQEGFIKDQIEYHLQNPLHCLDRWQKAAQFAVMKEGRKSAIRVLDTYNQAFAYCVNNNLYKLNEFAKGVSIVERPGLCVRCGANGFYCPCWSICPDAVK